MKPSDCILFSGGAPGAESQFGACAERHGVEEVNFTFDGHKIERQRGVRVLNHEELLAGDVSLEYLSRLLHRRYSEGPTLRKILQTLWDQVNNGQEIYVIGTILEDDTVRGGTGWGAEFAKLCNKPLYVLIKIATHGFVGLVLPGPPPPAQPRRSSPTHISRAVVPGRSVITASRRSKSCLGDLSMSEGAASITTAEAGHAGHARQSG